MNALRVIAIDGPGGSGKSTVSRLVAGRLGWSHLDTGGFYRAATLLALEAGIDPSREDEVLGAIAGHRLTQREGTMWIDGEDVSDSIRTPGVDATVSEVSAHPEVRERMVELQREWVRERGGQAVVEGRDIGSVVFPNAPLKVFLTADPTERARRRAGERGGPHDLVLGDLERRDAFDSSRVASPLRLADDAEVIDTTSLSIEQVVDRILDLWETRAGLN